ncbi:TonB-dependent receptor, partial [Campylobacter sp. MIT 12-8780]|uniref:TonB-dependent receptor domain-containing protein n=1 Tax=unclassified Campylobacter TaxID=2593542 RepID=UPI00115F2EA7
PGAYTQVDPSQGGVSVNIRGMTGLGRVNTMIDGVPQTFFGTSEDRLNSTAHPTPGGMSETGTSAFSTLIDPNFIIGLDINKGTFSGASGNNALMGSANFRTIGIDDIVSEGKNFGLLSKYSYGTNGLGHSYMIAFAQKSYSILNGGYAGAMYAFSGRNISQDYRIGGGGSSTDTSDPNIPPSIIAKNLEQRPQSHLLKFEFAPKDNQKAIFSYRRYETHLAGREISSNNYQLNYNLNPNSSYFDINFLAAYTENMQDFDQDFIWITLPVDRYFDDVKSFNKAFVLDLNNKSIIDLAQNLSFDFTLGANYQKNDYRKKLKWNRTKYPQGAYDINLETAVAFLPQGTQELSSAYLDTNLNYEIIHLNTNLNFTHSKLSGEVGRCTKREFCGQYYDMTNPPNFKPFEKKDDYLNFSSILALNFHELFTPFASYTQSTRALNVQEQFTSGAGGGNINVFLKPESATTYQIGFNSFFKGFLLDQESFTGFKVVYFHTKIKNYIYDAWDNPDNPVFVPRLNDEAKFQGMELEFNFDLNVFYTRLSYTHSKASYPHSLSSASAPGMGMNASQFSELPQDYGTLDIGTRLFSQKLVLGSLFKYTGKAKRINPLSENLVYGVSSEELPEIPTIIDLYASIEPFKNFTIKGEVQNLQDRNYMNALYTYNSSSSNINGDVSAFNNAARGRTYVMSFSYKY